MNFSDIWIRIAASFLYLRRISKHSHYIISYLHLQRFFCHLRSATWAEKRFWRGLDQRPVAQRETFAPSPSAFEGLDFTGDREVSVDLAVILYYRAINFITIPSNLTTMQLSFTTIPTDLTDILWNFTTRLSKWDRYIIIQHCFNNHSGCTSNEHFGSLSAVADSFIVDLHAAFCLFPLLNTPHAYVPLRVTAFSTLQPPIVLNI